MLITYLFGLKNAFKAGPEYTLAISVIALCTDTQWDMLEAITTIAKVDISKNRYNYKIEIRNAYIYTLLVICTSIVMSIILTFLNKINITIALIYLSFQIFNMLINPYTKIISAFTQLEYSPTINTIIYFTFIIVRTILSVFIISPYCTEIGQIVQCVMVFISLIIIRVLRYEIKDGKITIKKEIIKNLGQNI